MTMDITEILSMVGTYGGITTVTTVIGGWLYRKQNRRLKESEAALAEANVAKAKMESKTDEFHLYKEQLDTANNRIIELLKINAEKETRFQESEKDKTATIRGYVADVLKAETELNHVNAQLIEAQKEIAELKVELEKKRCDDLPCPFRRPPNAHTPAETGGRTREEYAKARDGINLDKK